ncbi:class I SAM-dependent methyltransferase [Nocardia sp. NPDC051321]|uniref:class I SAM-dependent methyltransferase n=1 Tax=Nocardia sp. NPDC051321 TaxID=3364323 RepID=UPI00379D75E5
MPSTAAKTSNEDSNARALSLRMFMAMVHTQEMLTCYLGVRLGLYELLAQNAMSPAELAERADIAPRYAREWLEQQAVAGLLRVVDSDTPELRYGLPPGHADVLIGTDNPLSMVSLAVLPLGGVAQALPSLLRAYRTGAGVPDAAFGADWRMGHSGANRALFTHSLVGWLRRGLPRVHTLLGGTQRSIADLACGAGWAAIALARAYPRAVVDGFDLDPEIVAVATRNAEHAGVADRVHFHLRDITAIDPSTTYDLVCLFDALHEMPHPARVLRACRAMRSDLGEVVVMDARVAPELTAPGDEIERFQRATSVLHCLPVSLDAADSRGTGTVLRPDTVRRLAAEAGFLDVRILANDDKFHRLYHLCG